MMEWIFFLESSKFSTRFCMLMASYWLAFVKIYVFSADSLIFSTRRSFVESKSGKRDHTLRRLNKSFEQVLQSPSLRAFAAP